MAKETLRTRWKGLFAAKLASKLKVMATSINSMMTELYTSRTNADYKVTVFQTATPANGGTTVLTDAVNDAHLVCSPAATIASHTFTFPSDANSRVGQILRISTSQTITAATFSGSGLTIRTERTGLAAGAGITFEKVAANNWRQVG